MTQKIEYKNVVTTQYYNNKARRWKLLWKPAEYNKYIVKIVVLEYGLWVMSVMTDEHSCYRRLCSITNILRTMCLRQGRCGALDIIIRVHYYTVLVVFFQFFIFFFFLHIYSVFNLHFILRYSIMHRRHIV